MERPRVATFFAATPEGARLVTVEGVSAADQRRAGRYMRAAQGLARGTYRTPAGELLVGAAAERDFQRRFSRWQPIAGMAIVSDPATVTALVVENREAGAEVHYDSGRSRPGRRRRTRSPSRRRSRSSSSSRSTAARSSRSGGASNQGEGLVELFDEAMVGVDEALEDAADALRDMGDDLR